MKAEMQDRRQTGPVFGEHEPLQTSDSTSVLVPILEVVYPPDPDQAYFWTEEWQKGEREADEDIREGRVKRFDDPDEAIRFLKNL